MSERRTYFFIHLVINLRKSLPYNDVVHGLHVFKKVWTDLWKKHTSQITRHSDYAASGF